MLVNMYIKFYLKKSKPFLGSISGRTDGRSDGQLQNYSPSPSAGDSNDNRNVYSAQNILQCLWNISYKFEQNIFQLCKKGLVHLSTTKCCSKIIYVNVLLVYNKLGSVWDILRYLKGIKDSMFNHKY